MLYNTADAHVRLHVGVNFGFPRVVVAAPMQVAYNEPANYDGDEDYYYLPDVDAYYSVPEQCYYYNDGGAWVSAAYLPGAYHDYDWRAVRHYEVRAPRPYMHNDFYRARYNGLAFNGRWNERAYDNRYREVEYNRARVAYKSQRFGHDNFRGRVDFRGRDNFRGHENFRDRGDFKRGR